MYKNQGEKSTPAVLRITGGTLISGELKIQGSKNSLLPILAATIVVSGECIIHNAPKISDRDAAFRILSYLGSKFKEESKNTVIVNTSEIKKSNIPKSLMEEMRSSIVFMGPILARNGECELSLPGGCPLGKRPIDYHINALKEMGAVVENYSSEHIKIKAPGGLHGARIALPKPSVGATENIILAAVTAAGETEIHNAAREPEIVCLCNFLKKCGAKISGENTGIITIEGVKSLSGTEHTVIPDRIASATYLTAAAITGGDILMKGVDAVALGSILPLFEQCGCTLYVYNTKNGKKTDTSIYLSAKNKKLAANFINSPIRTGFYPYFPTDAQPPLMALSCILKGCTIFVEEIFENRYSHAAELVRMGANIKTEGKVAVIEGVENLKGAEVNVCDLRAGASLVLAAISAEGVSTIRNLSHIDRGYENFEENLNYLGAKIKRL